MVFRSKPLKRGCLQAFCLPARSRIWRGTSFAAYPEWLRVDEFKLSYFGTTRIFSVAFVVTDSAGTVLAKADFDVQKIDLK